MLRTCSAIEWYIKMDSLEEPLGVIIDVPSILDEYVAHG